MAYDHLEKVKNMLGITGTFQDDTVQAYIEEVIEYMKGAGVNQAIIDSSKATGVIARGVSDLWTYGQGTASLSPYFYQRCTQLSYVEIDEGGTINES